MIGEHLLLLVHLGATFFMVGLIWFVQVVHYPLFGAVGLDHFTRYENSHTRLTTWVVAPPMLLEALTGGLLLWFHPDQVANWQPVTGLALLLVVWVSTACIQVPRHNRLSLGYDLAAHQALVWTNWIRTVAWSVRGVLGAWMVLVVMH